MQKTYAFEFLEWANLLTSLDHFFIIIFIKGSCFQIFQSAT
jgi:hypothetical protein